VSEVDPERVLEMVGLDLVQAEELLEKLGAAIRNRAVKEVTQLAHQFIGVSANLGMTAIVSPLQELERVDHSDPWSGAERSFAEADARVRLITCR